MTKQQRSAAIEVEVSRGADALRSAELLIAQSLFADSVSRAYYAALHFARALLLLRGAEPRTHAGVQRLLSLEFVRSGDLPAAMSHHLSALEKQRSDADYTAEIVFDHEAAALALDHARAFITAARAVLGHE